MRYFVLVFVFVLCSCSRQVYIPVETVRTEHRDVFLLDSVFLRDSIFLFVKGDTVYKERYVYRSKEVVRRDSIFLCDSIEVPYPVEVVRYKTDFKHLFYCLCVLTFILFIFSAKSWLRKIL